VAAGAVNDYFHNADIATHSFKLNDLDAAQALRNQILSCFEAAIWAADPAERSRQLTFAVVGDGPTGVELSAALSILVSEVVGRDFPTISAGEPSIVLIEGRTAPGLGPRPRPGRRQIEDHRRRPGIHPEETCHVAAGT
jgi:NADH:ubiquinone reductase (H+-translocating)